MSKKLKFTMMTCVLGCSVGVAGVFVLEQNIRLVLGILLLMMGDNISRIKMKE